LSFNLSRLRPIGAYAPAGRKLENQIARPTRLSESDPPASGCEALRAGGGQASREGKWNSDTAPLLGLHGG